MTNEERIKRIEKRANDMDLTILVDEEMVYYACVGDRVVKSGTLEELEEYLGLNEEVIEE